MSSSTLADSSSASSAMKKLYKQLEMATQDIASSFGSASSSSTAQGKNLTLCNKLEKDVSKIKSSYWRVDDSTNDDCLSKLSSLSIDEDLVATGSTGNHDNLHIYSLDTQKTLMTHLTTISLPDIHSLQWLYDPLKKEQESCDMKFLLSGHSKGIVNLIMVPMGVDSQIANAQIIKRFNHEKHVENSNTGFRIANNGKPTNVVYDISVTPQQWTRWNKNSLISLYKENIFLWDTTRSRMPILASRTNGITTFDTNHERDGLLALAGSFGISLFDLRDAQTSCFSTPFFIPDKRNKDSVCVKWCDENTNYLCSADVNDRLTIWDIRNMKPMATLEAHTDSITSIQWKKLQNLYSSSKDGSVIYWDLSSLTHDNSEINPIKCTTKNSFNMDVTYNEIGTSIPVSNNSIVSMVSVDDNMTLTMDDSFLGLHVRHQQTKCHSPTSTLVDPMEFSFKNKQNHPPESPAVSLTETLVPSSGKATNELAY